MSDYKILHNPKCSKSREALKMLEEAQVKFEVVEYLKTPLTEQELLNLIDQLLQDEPKDLVRLKEDKYKELKFDLSNASTIAKNLAKYPYLLERPIVIHHNKAIIGRPLEKIKELL